MHLGIFSVKPVFSLVVLDKVLKISFFVEFRQKYMFREQILFLVHFIEILNQEAATHNGEGYDDPHSIAFKLLLEQNDHGNKA